MPSTAREIIEQAFEAGRAAAKYEMNIFAQIIESVPTEAYFRSIPAAAADIKEPEVGGVKTPSKRASKASQDTNESKVPVVASAVKKVVQPRTKGVKQAITSMISDNLNGATIADIVTTLGFKETSVRATLMGLKKSGLATQDGKLWRLSANANGIGGNSETVAGL